MAQTIVASATREWIIGDDKPFTVIGERLNPTNRKTFIEELAAGNYERVERDALSQTEAGAHMLDVNAGIPPHMGDESKILVDMINIVQGLTDLPLAVDSSVKEALIAGVEAANGRPLINSVTGEDESLEVVLPLAAKYDCPVVAICNDETGISPDPEVRFAVAKKIVERAADHGIKANDIVIDPLVMPLGATPADAVLTYSQQAFEIVAKIRAELGANTTCGLSNVSFGLPNRHWMNGIFVAMAAGYGMTSAIMNPLHEEEMTSVRAADALLGHDQSCMKWMAKYRAPAPEGADGSARGRRGGGRRRAAA